MGLRNLKQSSTQTGPSLSSSSSAFTGSSSSIEQPPDCPPDVEVLGRSTWTFLHTMASKYPEKPTNEQQTGMSSFLNILSEFYPCWYCAKDFRDWMKRDNNKPQLSTKNEFADWLCRAHNEVNHKLGKELFDCSPASLDERWGNGPTDGRCG